MTLDAFLASVQARSGLGREHAEIATQVVLGILAQAMSPQEMQALAVRLPLDLKPCLVNPRLGEGVLPAAEFVEAVARREGVSPTEARVHADAVLGTLWEAIAEAAPA